MGPDKGKFGHRDRDTGSVESASTGQGKPRFAMSGKLLELGKEAWSEFPPTSLRRT